jgi:hypothetical protein
MGICSFDVVEMKLLTRVSVNIDTRAWNWSELGNVAPCPPVPIVARITVVRPDKRLISPLANCILASFAF